MKSRHIIKRVRQATLLRFSLILILTIVVGTIGAFAILPYFKAKLSVPTEFTITELESYTSLESFRFVHVQGSEMFDTGFKSHGESLGINYYYGALLVGSKLLIIKSDKPIELSQLSYIGTLSPASQVIKNEIIQVIIRQEPDLYGVILLLSLDVSTSYDWIWIVAGAFWLIFFALAVGFLIQAFLCLLDPKRHSILKTLARYGDVIIEIEGELLGSEKVEKYETTTLTKNWICYELFASFRAVRCDSVVWFHKTLSRHSVDGVETGVVASITIYDNTGHRTLIGAQTYAVDIILESIREHSSSAVVGYSPELQQLWKKDSARFIASVEERKSKSQKS
jgi:hypothetical protein